MNDLIEFDSKRQVFHLHNGNISYLFSVEEGGTLCHLYFGRRVQKYHGELKYPRVDRGFSGNLPGSLDRTFSRDTLPKEYSGAGEMDYHTPAAVIRRNDGSNALMLRYSGYSIEDGKPELEGLPAAWVEKPEEAQTLTVTLKDEPTGLLYDLLYTIYRDVDIITRSVRVRNAGNEDVFLEKAASLQIDFTDRDFDSICLPGAHANERHPERQRVGYGIQKFGSIRGTSSHQMNPFLALADRKADEYSGDVYGFAMVYSGNHSFEVERDQIDQTHLVIGINDYNFSWKLEPGSAFQTPEVLMTYSDRGFDRMSQSFHRIIRDRIVRSRFAHEERPILVNNWEATYFDFDEEKLKTIVDDAKDLGIEMFVLDDGWFGHRDDDNSSLGDWKVYERKFPSGLGHFADYVHEKGLGFGLWFEPEMISYDSDLYRDHPEYLMHVPGREPSPSRNQYVLDLTRKEVVDNLFEQVSEILESGRIDYVKWDMNRHLSDVYSASLPKDRQGEVYHRYVLGLYDLMERLTEKFPDVLFEGCSGGGGRFDAGMAYYMPQIWTSDNTDAVSRLTIQYGTSLVYPISMTTAHVSAIPNHQTGRKTPFETRGNAAMSAVFGYELDLTRMSQEDRDKVKEQVSCYKDIRNLVQYGTFHRLKSPVDTNQAAWMFVSDDRRDVCVMTFQVLASAQPSLTKTKLTGLDPELEYENLETGEVFGGDELMELGFYDPVVHQDYTSKMYRFRAL
ncbi:alpha-galactosidase [Ligilactobacillus sp.]|uniref:alpha-galactosidase n=1 Tax=Ligilactobacillus sp. TaxID=2767921 RepID=UPI002FDF6840